MTLSNSLLSFQDCIEMFDAAMADPRGVRYKLPSVDDAAHLRHRLHHARELHRRENAKTFEVGHPMHGHSEYDAVTCRIRNITGDCYILLERTDKLTLKAESLSEVEAAEATEDAADTPEFARRA